MRKYRINHKDEPDFFWVYRAHTAAGAWHKFLMGRITRAHYDVNDYIIEGI